MTVETSGLSTTHPEVPEILLHNLLLRHYYISSRKENLEKLLQGTYFENTENVIKNSLSADLLLYLL